MARQATTADTFNAIADGGRRRILDALRDGERSVSQLVADVGSTQPQVSRHLGVLRAVAAVTVRAEGRRRMYALNPVALRTVDDWLAGYRRLWDARFDELDAVLDHLGRDGGGDDG